MANMLTHSLTFDKESLTEFFIDPMFQATDIRDQITVRTDIKGTEKLNRVSRPSKITKRKTSPGFTPVGTLALTQTDITVKEVAIEFEQNGRAFLDSVLAQATAKGYNLDDVEAMSNPAFWDELVLPIIAEAGQDDLIRQIFFADEKKETNSGGIITGVADTDYQVYTGFWTRFVADITAGTIPASQYIAFNNGAAKQEVIETLTNTTAGTIILTINSVAYSEVWDTDIATTVNNWFASHAANILARGQLTGMVITNPSTGVLKFVASHAGQAFTVVETDAGTNGTWTASGVVANVGHAALGTDEADTTMNNMINNMPTELQQMNPVFMATRSVVRNYIATLKATGTEQAHLTIINGQSVLMYEGYPIFTRPDWDKWITADNNSVYPHRIVLGTQENLIFGTDGAQDDEAVQSWYNIDEQMRRYRVQYRGQTAYLHKELLVVAH